MPAIQKTRAIKPPRFAIVALILASLAGSVAASDYLVFVDGDAFRPAAERLARHRRGTVIPFAVRADDAMERVTELVRRHRARFAAFVLPPHEIDVDLAHRILATAVRIDDDPFVDFEYGFITGRDGAAASAFVDNIIAASKRTPGNRAGFFASWEGPQKPTTGPMSSFAALGFEGEMRCVLCNDDDATRAAEARAALDAMREHDALLFFSHGYPDRMASCFTGENLRDWKTSLRASVLVNCSCYNGATGRWFAPGPNGPIDKGIIAPDASVALALLDTGIAGYIAGIDPWHGPLAAQVFHLVASEGMRLGEATKRMFDRLALAFLPERIRFPKTMNHRMRFAGEGVNNRRHNGAGMILFGDPAFRPFPRAKSKGFAELTPTDDGAWRLRIGTHPLLAGRPGQDFLIPMNVVLDYYSVKTASGIRDELAMEFHRVIPKPRGFPANPRITVRDGWRGVNRRRGKLGVTRGRCIVEETRDGALLHFRVELEPRWMPPGVWPMRIAKHGATATLRIDDEPTTR